MCACSVESPTPSANIPKPVRTLDCVRSEHGHNATIVAAVLAAAVGILHAKQLALQPHARRHAYAHSPGWPELPGPAGNVNSWSPG